MVFYLEYDIKIKYRETNSIKVFAYNNVSNSHVK